MNNLTVDQIEAAYSLLKTFSPFKGWHLPDADDIEIRITNHNGMRGECIQEGPKLILNVSHKCHGHTLTLLNTLAHECVHLRQAQLGINLDHGEFFQKAAKQVCRIHGFDPKDF